MGPNNDLCHVYCVFRSRRFPLKNLHMNFWQSGNNLKKKFVPNVAAKVAITPKNSEKSYFCFFMMIFGDLCQNKKNNQICSFCPIFSLFLKFIFSPILSVTSKNLIVAKVQPYNSRNYSRIKIWCFAEIFDIVKICQE